MIELVVEMMNLLFTYNPKWALLCDWKDFYSDVPKQVFLRTAMLYTAITKDVVMIHERGQIRLINLNKTITALDEVIF